MNFKNFFVPTKQNNYRAHLLRLEALGVLTLGIFLFNSFAPSLTVRDVKAEMDINSIVYLHNRERTKRNLSTLTLNTKLIESAELKAGIMLENDCWDHYCPPGVSPWENFDKVNYRYTFAGENLAEGFKENNSMMKAWMNSITHRENVLKPEFSEVGIGYVAGDFQNKKDNLVVAVHFGHPVGKKLTLKEEVQQISDPIDPLKPVNVTYPLNYRFYNNQYLNIKGEVGPGIAFVEIFDGTESMGKTLVNDGRFSYQVGTEDEPLSEGTHRITANAYDTEGDYVDVSNDIKFTIDTLSPEVDLEKLDVTAIAKRGSSTISVALTEFGDVFQSKLIIDGVETVGVFEGNEIVYEIDYFALKESREIQLLLIDEATNEGLNNVPKQLLVNQADDLIESSGLGSVTTDITKALSVAKLDFNFNIGSLGAGSTLNLIVISFLIMLLIIDYAAIKKYHLIDTHRHGHHHLKIGVLIVVGLFTITASGIGSVLTGVSI